MTQSTTQFYQLGAEIGKAPFAYRNYSRTRSVSLRYFRYRVLRPFLKFKYNRYLQQNTEVPWIAPDAVNALKSLLKPDMVGFEFGSGRSTQFYAKRIKFLTSIEHHKDWYHSVAKTLEDKKTENVNLVYIPSDLDAPSQHLSSEAQLYMTIEEYPVKDSAFSTYSNSIKQQDDESLDFIAIDGRARATCLINAIPKLKSGGILLLDNSERQRYQQAKYMIAHWPKINTTNGLTDTTIWLKP
ncbi:MAG: hypothetical protein COW03_14005 [Cytophagales bacterium CG12_big_fil_rev_8_21_14_0_65_40_12]|nr:MAG: hypothetical protein COW03_14005 [Cytophagales bacterium CG12_big_fil_rev_8_21_14_0_65_40_12]PIW03790.1 MAG: class I SAM-dependent methyltransferase [Cytophagales bacterium CG17_big_fil_post_rev_8_21_14_2_50_40_13]